MVLARNEPDEECVACGETARWRLLAPDSDAREPIPFCDECRSETGRHQLVMNSLREGTDCYDNVMSWDGMPIVEPNCRSRQDRRRPLLCRERMQPVINP